MVEAPTVALAEEVHGSAQQNFEAHGYRVITFPGKIEEERLSDLLRRESAEFVGTRSVPPITATVIGENPQLDGIGRFGKGLDGIALEAADEAGIGIFISPRGNLDSVAEMVIGGIYAMMRNIPRNDRLMRAGGWPKGSAGNHQVKGKVLGSIGMGGVGPIVAELARGNRMEVVGYDVEPGVSTEFATMLDSKEAVLAASDIVTLHVPLTDSTRGMISTEALSLMRHGSYLINAARGELVDMSAIDAALREGHLAGALLDVFNKEVEAEAARGSFDVPFIDLDQAIFSPHNAGNTEDAQASMGEEVSGKYIRHKATGATPDAINLPTLVLGEPNPGVTRIIYVHTDEPNAIRGVADIVGDAGLNIGPEGNAQFDGSGNKLSVAYFDITRGEVTPRVMEAIRALPLTRRAWSIPPV